MRSVLAACARGVPARARRCASCPPRARAAERCSLSNRDSTLRFVWSGTSAEPCLPCEARGGKRGRRQRPPRQLPARSHPAEDACWHTHGTSYRMRGLLVLALVVAVLCTVDAERHRRKHRRLRTTTTERPGAPDAAPVREDSEAEHLELGMAERLDEKRFQESERSRVNELMNEVTSHEVGDNDANILDDPCLRVHCSAGRVCEIDEHGDAVCNCIKECPYETDSRRKVCTNHNETWTSDCEVYQQRCLCLDGSELCRGPQYHHVQIEYYGMCREMPECSENEMSDFPRRMRDWLFNIMRDMAERRELTPHYLRMEREAETNLTRRWTNAAIWKWCDLDAHDNDRFVSRHELFPIRAPLMALEHCIAPFLDRCDEDDDHRVTLAEWGKCLQLDEYELEDRCDEFTDEGGAAPQLRATHL
ncbi:hypothetical protein PYW08_016166 [Mythimna loreyi]|uniref:Uncharacterized protein n=1 Tax=Mythimna loreyi TaxID=667449 RepID=A0ACC2QTS1_9NEOP|nr:hypothetical protein PYW08_016166 [Mythimna loreyi]